MPLVPAASTAYTFAVNHLAQQMAVAQATVQEGPESGHSLWNYLSPQQQDFFIGRSRANADRLLRSGAEEATSTGMFEPGPVAAASTVSEQEIAVPQAGQDDPESAELEQDQEEVIDDDRVSELDLSREHSTPPMRW